MNIGISISGTVEYESIPCDTSHDIPMQNITEGQ